MAQEQLGDPLFEDLRYLLTDAQRVGRTGLWVGSEYDFSVAMMMPDVGAGLAAQKRREKNEAIARLLHGADVDLSELLEKHIARRARDGFDTQLAVLGIIYGEPKTAVQIHVVATRDKGGEAAGAFSWRMTHVTQAPGLLQAEGDEVVSVDRAALKELLQKAADELASAVAQLDNGARQPSCPQRGPKHVCPLGGSQEAGDIVPVEGLDELYCVPDTALPDTAPLRIWICPDAAAKAEQAGG